MDKTMTTKEIARAVGKEYRAVQNWVSALSAKNADVRAKIADAYATKKPAAWSVAEVCQIIEEGMGAAAAGVYRNNATVDEMAKQIKLPSGAQMLALERIFGADGARARIDFAMGFKPASVVPRLSLPAGLSKQAYAVEFKNREKAEVERRANALTPELPL